MPMVSRVKFPASSKFLEAPRPQIDFKGLYSKAQIFTVAVELS